MKRRQKNLFEFFANKNRKTDGESSEASGSSENLPPLAAVSEGRSLPPSGQRVASVNEPAGSASSTMTGSFPGSGRREMNGNAQSGFVSSARTAPRPESGQSAASSNAPPWTVLHPESDQRVNRKIDGESSEANGSNENLPPLAAVGEDRSHSPSSQRAASANEPAGSAFSTMTGSFNESGRREMNGNAQSGFVLFSPRTAPLPKSGQSAATGNVSSDSIPSPMTGSIPETSQIAVMEIGVASSLQQDPCYSAGPSNATTKNPERYCDEENPHEVCLHDDINPIEDEGCHSSAQWSGPLQEGDHGTSSPGDLFAEQGDSQPEVGPRSTGKKHEVKPKKKPQKYLPEWKSKLDWLEPSSNSEFAGYCDYCKVEVKCTAGLSDLLTHAGTKKHTTRATERKSSSQRKLTPFVNTSFQDKVRKSEMVLCAWGAANNQPMLQLESFAAILPKICPDSEIAKTMRLGRTKASAIVVNVLGAGHHEDLSAHLQCTPFCLIADESTDIAGKKTLALIARTHVWITADRFEIRDYFYDLVEVVETDAETLYDHVVRCFAEDNIPYTDRLKAFAADGANNVTGKKKSLGAHLKKDCEALFQLKCTCHSMALAASYACRNIPNAVEQMCRDIYTYLSASPLRTSKFEEIQILLEYKPAKMLHPSATRWLSLEAVVQRVLDRYEPLKIYFQFLVKIDQVESPKVNSIHDALENPATKLYLLFLSYVLPMVNKLNKLFQSEQPELFKLHSAFSRLFKSILTNFVKDDYLRGLGDRLGDVIYEEKNYVDLSEVYIGVEASSYMSELFQGKKLDQDQTIEFQKNVRSFYETLAKQLLLRIDFNDPAMVNLSIIDPRNIIERKHQSIVPLLQSFPNIARREDYQLADNEFREIRSMNLGEFECYAGDATEFWNEILKVEVNNGEKCFPILRGLIPVFLSLPHSSAAVERFFSDYNNNKTKLRNRMKIETVRGVLSAKSMVKYNPQMNFTDNITRRFNNSMYTIVEENE